MEATLITRNPGTDAQGNLTTSDLTLDLVLAGQGKRPREAVDTLPASEWSTSAAPHAHRGAAAPAADPRDHSYRPHALSGFSEFGSDEPNEFATFVQGREAWDGNSELRDNVEDDLRLFAERSDHTEGFLLTTRLSTGFSGLTASFLELLRDEHPKAAIWSTALLSNARGWKRADSDRARVQRLLNAALGLVALEDLASMVLPVQPVREYSDWVDGAGASAEQEWRRFLRDDVDRSAAYEQVLTMHLQSAGSELREPDVLSSLIEQLNWRGGNKIASLCGATPLAPVEYYGDTGEAGVKKLKSTVKDWSMWEEESQEDEGKKPKREEDDDVPYAQYGVARGLDFEDSQAIGPLLEKSATPLKEPLSRWVSLPDPYPVIPSSLPIYRGLHPQSGHPLVLPVPSTALPVSASPTSASSAALFGLPDARFPSALSYTASQPRSLPILTTLSTSPSARHYLRHLALGVKELRRVRAGVLREYEGGEYGVGREGVDEARERIEALWDAYGGGAEDDEGDEGGKDEDEDWTATEQQDEWDL
ncbi:uncharacterized protein JCM10292_007198 [Rhodotorula paludigena]|uniref:uncharacterized protein n=1 Tax=Rhodotorula paludigena TaxID=86838 RepID=UPI00317CB555